MPRNVGAMPNPTTLLAHHPYETRPGSVNEAFPRLVE